MWCSYTCKTAELLLKALLSQLLQVSNLNMRSSIEREFIFKFVHFFFAERNCYNINTYVRVSECRVMQNEVPRNKDI